MGMRSAFRILCLLFITVGMAEAQNNGQAEPSGKTLPSISLNFGLNHLMSDVPLESQGPSPFTQFGYQLSVEQKLAKFLSLSFDLYTGTVYGDTRLDSAAINFRTTLFSQHLNVEYNFYPLLKPNSQGRQLVRPYLGFGVGMLYFRAKGDLKNGSNETYFYWSDGTTRSVAEGSAPPTEARIISRDLNYETDLRNADLDGLGKYPQLAFSLPINAGVRFQITKNFGVNAGFTYAMNFTDLIDNVSPAGKAGRQGKAGYDNHLFGSVGITVFLGRTSGRSEQLRFEEPELAKKNSKPAKPDDGQTAKTASADVLTESPESPDDEKFETSENAVMEKTDDAQKSDISEKPETNADSSDQADVREHALTGNQTDNSQNRSVPVENDRSEHADSHDIDQIESIPPKPSLGYHWADLNKNGLISPDEVLHFIDLLFDRGSQRTVTDIQNLIDYYFDQE